MKSSIVRLTLFCLVLCLLGLPSCREASSIPEHYDTSPVRVADCTVVEEQTDLVMLEIEDYGSIVIRLYPQTAPLTVQNFKDLISARFYDGLIIHRVEEGFVLQGGSPTGDGLGGSGTNIKGEFAANGVANDLPHERGVVSMARTSLGYDTASSQFFIMHGDAPHLDGGYAAFGYVVAGMKVVDAIAKVEVNTNKKPRQNVVIRTAVFVKVDE